MVEKRESLVYPVKEKLIILSVPHSMEGTPQSSIG